MRTFPDAVLVVSLCVLGCGQVAEPTEVERTETPIINGVTASSLPGVGVLSDTFNNLCTAALVAPRFVITAAHCIAFSTSLLRQPVFHVGSGTGYASSGFAVQQIFNLGPTGFTGGDLNRWALLHLHTTTDFSGTDDIALLLLTQPVPDSVVPMKISGQPIPPPGPPPRGTTLGHQPNMFTWGFGCSTQTGSDFGVKRYAKWNFAFNNSGLFTSGDLIDPNGNLVHSTNARFPTLPTGGFTCVGDSGGPTFLIPYLLGSPIVLSSYELWGVTSAGVIGSSDTFGAVAFLRKPVCSTVYSSEPHSVCTTGAPLLQAPVGCSTSQGSVDALRNTDATISQVCASTFDPYCCQTAWDGQCVNEAASFDNCSI